MSDGLYIAQDVALKSCKIVGSSGQPIEFKNLIVEFNYFEDIFANSISGALVVNDSMGYINMMQMQGQEVLLLELDKPGLDNPIEKNFRIYNISFRKTTKGSNENYVINFCSEELMLNEQYKVSKSYTKSKVVDIVKDIAKNFLKIDPEKFINLDDTSGLRDIVIPNFKPFQALNWLCTFAKSNDAKNIGSPFLFYEDRNGFNFKSILTLFQQPVYRTYHYDAKNLKSEKNNMVSDINKEVVNVIAYEQLKSFDTITAVRSGAMANKTITVDPLRLKFGESKFDYNKYKENAASLQEKGNVPTSAINRNGDKVNETFGSVKFCMTTTGQSENKYFKDKQITIHENRIEETVPLRTAQLALFCSNRMKILIPGDVEVTVGKVIEFLLPDISYNNPGRKKSEDKYYSGKYIVTAVRHMLTQENTFTTCLEICKESFPDSYNDFDNTDAGWKGIR
jgi:hypothetical protein